ncbi:pitrilysin family protein [Lichenihabitans sp. Uapishka_5]|uniref:M16 family metallopeptidase n=1 Tax=Lichenihabitans sp. Uapishka_5 TaxID=3037302 RepID=UPI0029E81474|nr:pitrilysin family protein [Lichenihabitans sp. Uapishka_5]MDX7952542.1 pitrilysin family protein [Lichenihabitans sp. Uapishka_5]
MSLVAAAAPISPAPVGLRPDAGAHAAAPSGPPVASGTLDNGMQVVVISDHRAPVVTHMVWYRNGSADDPAGKSGIAHFLEHLMFKGTARHPQGAFSDAVAEVGGQENAFTSNDYTAYFQRVTKDHLGTLMGFEADRMTNLELSDAVVVPERDVVLEERRMRTDTDPSAQLGEAVQAALYSHHPYGKPIIGWNHEIEGLNRADALDYYARFYTPENAILVVAGDVTYPEVEALARTTYGAIPARGAAPVRVRQQEPEPRAHRLVTLADPKVEQPSVQRLYVVPSYSSGAEHEGAALEVLAHHLGGGSTSVLYKTLVLDQAIAVSAGAYYMGTALDATRFYIWAVPAAGVSLETLDAAIDAVVRQVSTDLTPTADLERAKTRLVADAVYAQDSQASLARWYGASLATGLTVADIARWPEDIEGVSAEAVREAAKRWLTRRRGVTGFLTQDTDGTQAAA